MTAPEGWVERLEEASFRGVAFYIASEELRGGQRNETSEYADRDKPHTRQFGRRARRWTVEAFVAGPDYDLQRDRLVAALEQGGPGELITSKFGSQTVDIDDFRVHEAGNEGRWAPITFSCSEHGANLEPSTQRDTQTETLDAIDAAELGILTAYLLTASSASETVGWVRTRALERAAEMQEYIGETIAGIQEGYSGDVLGTVAALDRDSRLFGASIDTLYEQAAAIPSGAIDLLHGIAALDAPPRERIRALDELRTRDATYPGTLLGGYFDRPASVTEPEDVTRDKANALADKLLVRRATAIAKVRAGLDVPLSSIKEVSQLRADLVGTLDQEIADAGATRDDDAYIALRKLRAAVILDLRTRGQEAPELVDFTPARSLSALLLSQRLYGTGARDLELVGRILPENEAFIPGGATLRVVRA